MKNFAALPDDTALEMIAARFRALSEPMRLKILHALAQGEMCVSRLTEKTGSGQANISKHLAVLLEAGMVSRRKSGLQVIYRIADSAILAQCESICTGLGSQLSARHDAVRKFARQSHHSFKSTTETQRRREKAEQ
jgi:ArsR family transcriptional regulator